MVDDIDIDEVEILDNEEILEDSEEAEVVLEFYDDRYPVAPVFAEIEARVFDILEEYSPEELFDLNEISPAEVVALLYSYGDIGLPQYVEDIEIEEDEDLPPEETDEDLYD